MSEGGKRVRIGSFCYTPAWILSVTSVRISQAWKRDDCLSAILCPRVYTFVGTGTLSLTINPSVGTGTSRFETRLHTGRNPQHFRYPCAANQAGIFPVFLFVLSVIEIKTLLLFLWGESGQCIVSICLCIIYIWDKSTRQSQSTTETLSLFLWTSQCIVWASEKGCLTATSNIHSIHLPFPLAVNDGKPSSPWTWLEVHAS